jgi:hypothetical protein
MEQKFCTFSPITFQSKNSLIHDDDDDDDDDDVDDDGDDDDNDDDDCGV